MTEFQGMRHQELEAYEKWEKYGLEFFFFKISVGFKKKPEKNSFTKIFSGTCKENKTKILNKPECQYYFKDGNVYIKVG